MLKFNYKKSLGQNFLNDQNILQRIVKSTNILPNSLTIEIGPGSGNLTKEIAKVSKNVLCYEIDERLEIILDKTLLNYDNIHIIYDDFLNRNILDDIKEYQYDNLYIVSNIPYYITTPIIEKIINSNLVFKTITLMMQKEMGDRLLAKVGTRDYSSLTVYLNYYFNIKKEFIVSRNCFTPRPNVDSIVITLNQKDKLYLKDKLHFDKLIRDSFKFKRKNIKNNLKNYDLEIVLKVLKKYNLDLTVRAETISLEIFAEISNSLVN